MPEKIKKDEAYLGYATARKEGRFAVLNSWGLVAPRLEGLRTLDAGCSDGLYLKSLSPDSVGIEQIPELAKVARERGHVVIEGDVETEVRILEKESFDAVLLSHVMEHVKRPIDLLEEIHRILRPGGVLILGLPTEKNIFRNVLKMDYFAGTHIYSFTTRNAEVLLRLVGLEPEPSVVYHLPKLRGKLGLRLHGLWNLAPVPGKEFLSLCYWMVAAKPRG
jgi:SAM-dependent methyltransferase